MGSKINLSMPRFSNYVKPTSFPKHALKSQLLIYIWIRRLDVGMGLGFREWVDKEIKNSLWFYSLKFFRITKHLIFVFFKFSKLNEP
jgi:hypothetical protein